MLDKYDISHIVLLSRESINIAVVIISGVLCVLLASEIVNNLKVYGYRYINWPTKLAVGLFFWFLGDGVRSLIVWWVIHNEGARGTYLSDIGVLLVALVSIVVGGMCAVRVMSPAKAGQSIWVATLILIVALVMANLLLSGGYGEK